MASGGSPVRTLRRGHSPPRSTTAARRARLPTAKESRFKPRTTPSTRRPAEVVFDDIENVKRRRLDAAVPAASVRHLTRSAAAEASRSFLATAPRSTAREVTIFPLDDLKEWAEEATTSQSRVYRGEGDLKHRLEQLGKKSVGSKRMRQALAKRTRSRRRLQRHTWSLRASRGLSTVLEELAMSPKTSVDFQRRLNYFWDFVDMHKLPTSPDKALDEALADWADLEFLSGEGFAVGEKLLQALERWALLHRASRIILVPRFRKVLRSWRKNAPRTSRLPCPEEYFWLAVGIAAYAGHVSMSLCLVAMFATYLRPTAMSLLYTDDLVSPDKEDQGHHVLVLAPVERETSTKTGFFDETVILDGDLCPSLGRLLQLQADAQDAAAAARGHEGPVPLWDFKPRELFTVFRGACELARLHDIDTLYQLRHGGASRDLLLKRRTAGEIQERLHHATPNSSRIYNKPGRILQLVKKLDDSALQFAFHVRDTCDSCVRAGEFPKPPMWRSGAVGSLGSTLESDIAPTSW